jgi:hypothetical protein
MWREDPGVNGRRILKWKLNTYGGGVSSEFSCLIITIEKMTFKCSKKTICFKTELPSGLKKLPAAVMCLNGTDLSHFNPSNPVTQS